MRILGVLALLVLAIGAVAGPPAPAGEEFLGKWNITIPGRDGGRGRACWLEVTREGDAFQARFLSGGGSPFPLKQFSIENGEMTWRHMAGRPPDQSEMVYSARVRNGKLEGTVTLGKEAPRQFTGVRPPAWPKEAPKRKPGQPVALFNGKDVSGWLPQDPKRPLGWTVKDGILVNDPPANNIYSEKKFLDFKVEVEFKTAAHSNSGVYLRGRHEIQVIDDYGKQPDEHSHGALYGFIVPSVNAGKPAGEWQKLEVTIVANRVTVILNGTKIIDNAVVPAITGGALDANEGQPGPIMLQGDHELIHYRKVVVTPLR